MDTDEEDEGDSNDEDGQPSYEFRVECAKVRPGRGKGVPGEGKGVPPLSGVSLKKSRRKMSLCRANSPGGCNVGHVGAVIRGALGVITYIWGTSTQPHLCACTVISPPFLWGKWE